MLVIWLAITFISFGLYAPRNGTVFTALLLASFSVAGALFLYLVVVGIPTWLPESTQQWLDEIVPD